MPDWMPNGLAIGEGGVRIAVFLAVLAAMALWEASSPRRPLRAGRSRRWVTNLAIVVIDSLAVRLLVPLAAVGTAALAAERGFGLFTWIGAPGWVAVVATLLVLDLAIWFQHWVTHKVPILWRLHRMHHADIDIDVTTALRFHPGEIVLSMLWKMLVVAVFGAPVGAVIAFEVILNAMAMFNHGNVALTGRRDAFLRLLVVTPDMHRVHHSVIRRETDSNYGFNLSIWDRLFRTYRAAPEKGHLGMTIGLPGYQSDDPTRIGWSLALPFRPLESGDAGDGEPLRRS